MLSGAAPCCHEAVNSPEPGRAGPAWCRPGAAVPCKQSGGIHLLRPRGLRARRGAAGGCDPPRHQTLASGRPRHAPTLEHISPQGATLLRHAPRRAVAAQRAAIGQHYLLSGTLQNSHEANDVSGGVLPLTYDVSSGAWRIVALSSARFALLGALPRSIGVAPRPAATPPRPLGQTRVFTSPGPGSPILKPSRLKPRATLAAARKQEIARVEISK